jgi:predicted dehydrogenase
MEKLRFALFGAGFWSPFQLNAWRETGLAECVAICDPQRERAEARAAQFQIPAVYTDPNALFAAEQVDFADIVTSPETHAAVAQAALAHRVPAVVQKPMTPSLQDAEALVRDFREAGVMLLVNENWRWQAPLRALKAALDSGQIGTVFRARLDYRNSFPVFDNQPFLKTLRQFIITDIGTHVLDAARWLFGEAETLYATTQRIHTDIQGEDVATIMLRMRSGATVIVVMSYATRREYDRMVETYAEVEGDQGFAELGPDYWLRITTADGTHARRIVPPRFSWVDPAYAVAQASTVPCQAHLARALMGLESPETTGEDNLETLRLVFSAYESAEANTLIHLR